MQYCRRHWTMPVELGLTVTPYTQTALATTPTLLKLTVTMLLTAISRRRAKLQAPVTLPAPQPLLQPIPALLVVLSHLAPALPAVQLVLQPLALRPHPLVQHPHLPALHQQPPEQPLEQPPEQPLEQPPVPLHILQLLEYSE